jgi:arsenate reductase
LQIKPKKMITIFHNSRCGKSRECLAFLDQSDQEVTLINYLVNPPTYDELYNIISMLQIKPIELVRQKESIWVDQFKNKKLTEVEIIQAMVSYPILIERPIVIRDGKAVIARPLDKIHTIL